jgi:hypothetical protein
MTPACETAGRFSTRTQIVLLGCACAGTSAFLFEVDPSRHGVYPRCLFHEATGLYCAGCGATRALYALLHGRWLEAAHDNLLFVGILPFLIGWAAFYLAAAWRENGWPEWKLTPRALAWRGAGIFLLMIFFMIARNLPGWPFDLLKPLGG